MLLLLLAACATPDAYVIDGAVDWQPFTDDVFDRAAAEDRLVLLEVGAAWCHWCHVMDAETWADPAVQDQIAAGFLPVRVDQDARPDLAHRYEDFGWPATVVLDATGADLVTFAGFVPAERMAVVLDAVRHDPTPGPSVRAAVTATPGEAGLDDALRAELVDRVDSGWDDVHGGWGTVHKYLDPDLVAWSLGQARRGDAVAAERAATTIALQAEHLHDPAWGGVYQYSHGGVWTNPHFEKIVPFQAGTVRVGAVAAAQGIAPDTAAGVVRYVETFLRSPEGAFYAAQDADVVRGEHAEGYFALSDADRRARGVPAVDTHRYAQANGQLIEALAVRARLLGDEHALDLALAAAEWTVAHRALPDGRYAHDEGDDGRFLGDTLAMGRACLALHLATGDRMWLDRAEAAANAISQTFVLPGVPGVATAARAAGRLEPRPQLDENAAVVSFAVDLAAWGDPRWRALGDVAMRWLASPEIARSRRLPAAVLVADAAWRTPVVRVALVGPVDDPRFDALRRAALADPAPHLWVGPDASYPPADAPAAYVCAAGKCSSPVTDPTEVSPTLTRLLLLP